MKSRLDFVTNSSSTSYLISVSDESGLSESERAILEFILNIEDDYDSEQAELLSENDNKRIYRKLIGYNSDLEKLLDKFSKISYREDDDYC